MGIVGIAAWETPQKEEEYICDKQLIFVLHQQ
jgi:hypothetical protein